MVIPDRAGGGRPLSVVSDCVRLSGFEYGDPSDETVILVHGWPDTLHLWARVTPLLAKRFHVVAYDQRGHGQSDVPTHWRGFGFDHLVADLNAVADAVSPDRPVHIVGHDFGGIYAWDAVCAPNAVERIASFTCIAGTNLDEWGLFGQRTLRRPTPRRLAGLLGQILSSSYIVTLFIPRFPDLVLTALGTPSRWRRALRLLSGIRAHDVHLADSIGADLRRGVAIYRANISRLIRPRRDRTAVPVLMIHGRYDIAIRRIPLDGLADRAPKLRWRHISAGHWSPFSHPDQIAYLTAEFIDEHNTVPEGRNHA